MGNPWPNQKGEGLILPKPLNVPSTPCDVQYLPTIPIEPLLHIADIKSL